MNRTAVCLGLNAGHHPDSDGQGILCTPMQMVQA